MWVPGLSFLLKIPFGGFIGGLRVKFQGQGKGDRLRCRGLYFLKNMGVNVCCSEYLRVTQGGRIRLNIHAVCDQ